MRKERLSSFWRKFSAISCIAFSYTAAQAMPLMALNESEPPRQQEKAAAAGPQKTRPAPRQSSEERLWQIAVDSDKAGAYDAYLRKYPNGRYAELAKARLANIDGVAKNTARTTATPQSIQGDSPRQPASIGTQEGQALSAEDELWKAATATGKASDYQAYLREYPEGRYASIAKNQLAGSSPPEQDRTRTSGRPTSAQNASPSPETPHLSAEQEIRTPAAAASGVGKTIRFDDQTMTGNFSSDPQTGKVSGTGRIVWTNGNRFDGTLVHGVKEGTGEFSWNNGQRYIGDWANDQPNGQGTIFFANGDRYEGDVKDGQADGQGIAKFKGGDSYAGRWATGKRHGTGRYSWAQGGYWEGEFRNGERTENGTLTRAPAGPPHAPHAPRSAVGDAGSEERQAAGKLP
jgi:hypothetical protein